MLPPVTEHVSLHSKSLCKNIARASGGCKLYAPTKLGGGGGGTNGKDPRYVFRFFYKKKFCFLWANKAPFVFPDFEVDRGIGYIDIGGGTAMQLYFYDPSETAAFNTWDKSHSLDIAPGNRYNLGLSRKRYTDASGFSNCIQEGKEGWVKKSGSILSPPPQCLLRPPPPVTNYML